MTSDSEKLLPDVVEDNAPMDEAESYPIGGRATPEERRVIDIASAIEGEKRGPWMIQVCVDRAKQVIDAHSRSVVNTPAA